MLHVPSHITRVIDIGGVSLWASSVCWDTKWLQTHYGIFWPREWPFIKLKHIKINLIFTSTVSRLTSFWNRGLGKLGNRLLLFRLLLSVTYNQFQPRASLPPCSFSTLFSKKCSGLFFHFCHCNEQYYGGRGVAKPVVSCIPREPGT